MIDLTTAFAVSISEGNARLSIFVAEHICQSVLRHRVGKLMAGLRVGRSSNIVPKPCLAKVLGVLGAMVGWMSELTEQGLKLLVPTYYKNEKELLKEAFRIIIRNNPRIRIDLALKLYNSEKTSLAKSAEIAGLTTIEFKEILADRGIKREIEGDEIEEIDRKIKEVFG